MFSKKIQFIHKKENKIIFKIENFLEQNLYNEIEKNFPVIDHERIILKESFGKKFIFSIEFSTQFNISKLSRLCKFTS